MSLGVRPLAQDAFGLLASPDRTRRFGARSAHAIVLVWSERRRTRRHLSTLDDRALADVGLTPAQQRSECAKSFWQL